MSKGKLPVKKIISIICTVLTVIIVALAVGIIVNMIVCRAKNKPVSFFGTSFALVQTNSMEPEIMTGDLIIFRTCNINDIKIGDNIVFRADENFDKSMRGQSIVHKVIDKTGNGIVTKGVHNAGNDGGYREPDEILGICTFHSSGWGKFFRFLSKYGIIIIIAVIAVPFIIKQVIKIVKLSKQKQVGDGANQNENTDKE